MTMAESYSDDNTTGVTDTMDQHGAVSSSSDTSNVKAAAFIIVAALALLWLFGGVVFRSALR